MENKTKFNFSKLNTRLQKNSEYYILTKYLHFQIQSSR